MSEPRTVRGFIIGRMAFGNTSLIVRVLTHEAGRLTFIAKGSARPKSPFAGLLDLFYLADFLYAPARSAEMHTLREVKLAEAHLGLRRSYANLIAAQYFADLIEAITEPATPVEGEYTLFGKALAYLCENDVTWRAVERFEHRVLIAWRYCPAPTAICPALSGPSTIKVPSPARRFPGSSSRDWAKP